MKYRQQYSGDWVKPRMKNYYMRCCGCGLVHRLNFKVIKHGRGHKVMFQAFEVKKKVKGKTK